MMNDYIHDARFLVKLLQGTDTGQCQHEPKLVGSGLTNFGMPYIDESGDNGYADQNAPDNQNGNIPLSDFFSLLIP